MEQPLVASPDVRLPLSCRPNRSNWGMAAFLGLFGLASFLIPLTDKGTAGHPADLKTDWIAAGLFCAFFLIPAILWAAWTRRASIIADKNGLHWRGLGRWRSAGWSDVTDYYKQLPQKRASSVPAVIETIAGRVKFDAAWAGSEGLQTVVVCRAANARPKEWGIIGTRPEDKWPRTFDYEPRKTRQRLFGFRLYLFALFALWAWVIIPRLVRTYGMAEWEWNVAIAVLLGILLASKGFIVCYAVRALRETLLWADRRITVCPDWIEFEDSRQTVRLFWPEMSDYYLVNTSSMTRQWHYVVEAKGEANEFLPTIQDAKLLAKIVSRYASASGRETWRRRESDALGGVAAKWSRGREGIGERIFGYCTRTNRALLWYLATFAISPALVAGLNALLGLSGPGSPGFPCGVTLSLNVLFFWCLWRYWTAHIQIDDQGISQAALFGKRFLAWEDVQDYFLSGDSETSVFGNVVGADGRRIRFWTSIADVEELKEGITRRAVRCREQAWEKKERQAALAKR